MGKFDEQYVRRGEIAFDLSFVGSLNDELEAMNFRKHGRPYRYPRSLIRFIRFIRDIWHVPLRQAEGVLRSIGEAHWRYVHDHGQRWRVEGAFSAVKRILGETLRFRRSDLVLREARHKFVQHSRLMMA